MPRGKDSALNPLPLPTTCGVATYAALRATPDDLRRWRREPGPAVGPSLPVTFLKHADEQTVAALTAVRRAIADAGWQGRSFVDWGVLAAPNFLGRRGIAQSLRAFAAEGPWGISPQLIPNNSLHAVSGTISQALGLHGPNFGIGGGPNAVRDALPLALTLVAGLPGLWLVLTGYEREWVPADSDAIDPAEPPSCLAVALALVPDAAAVLQFTLRATAPDDALPELTLPATVDALAGAGGARWHVPGFGTIALDFDERRERLVA